MKKTFLLMAIAAISFSAAAQDTLVRKGYNPIENYFYYGNYPEPGVRIYPAVHTGPQNGGEMAKQFYSKDTLTIYGIAAGIKDMVSIGVNRNEFYDTTDTATYEYLRLYTPQPDTPHWVRQEKVHLHVTPISYYVDYNHWCSSWTSPNPDKYICPVYERYFDSAETVSDSFYLGMTQWGQRPYRDANGNLWHNPHNYLGLYQLGTGSTNHLEIWYIYFFDNHSWLRFGNLNQQFTLIFPILTPNPDTMNVDTTSIHLGAGEVSLNDRFTGVMPNPAAEKARVVSSFGMSMVEVFDPNGAAVLTRRTEGLYTDIDVSHWPAGTYLVRIHTPQGVATKKLVVSR